MLTFENFAGINNVLPSHRIKPSELVTAVNVDMGLSGEVRRRRGYSEVTNAQRTNLHQADGFMLATNAAGELVSINGPTTTVLTAALGAGRMWYCDLPDGRTTYSNGTVNGITKGSSVTGFGVPIPASIGTLTPVSGNLFAGDYQWSVTHVRLSDGLEGGPAYSNPVAVTLGGVVLTGLPVLSGYATNVYLTSHNGGPTYYAGRATAGAFSFTGKNSALNLPCRTEFMSPAPVGTVTAFWRGRVLIAKGSTLWASKQSQWETFDLARDFKQFSANITLIQPVEGGIFVGTEDELAFLAGTEFDGLVYAKAVAGRVVLGSGVSVDGERIKRGDGTGSRKAMICIADGGIVAGFADGGISRMTKDTYRTAVTEVTATFTEDAGIPQYISVPL